MPQADGEGDDVAAILRDCVSGGGMEEASEKISQEAGGSSRQWRLIPSLGFRYEASEDGEIRNLATGHILSSHADHRRLSSGEVVSRPQISIDVDGKTRKFRLARLVCEAWWGPPRGRDADHMNHDTEDNRAENLQWLSRSQNIRRAIAAGRFPQCLKGRKKR